MGTLHKMICHGKKCRRPRSSSCHKEQRDGTYTYTTSQAHFLSHGPSSFSLPRPFLLTNTPLISLFFCLLPPHPPPPLPVPFYYAPPSLCPYSCPAMALSPLLLLTHFHHMWCANLPLTAALRFHTQTPPPPSHILTPACLSNPQA